MWEWLRSVLWENRNEPLAVIMAAVLLAVVLFTLFYQVLYRQTPLYCQDGNSVVILPGSKSDCPQAVKPIPPTDVPIGTIVALK